MLQIFARDDQLPPRSYGAAKRRIIKQLQLQKKKSAVIKKSAMESNDMLNNILHAQLPETIRILKQRGQPSDSSWLSATPLAEEGFDFNKREFGDALVLRFNQPNQGLPSNFPYRS